MNGIEAMNKKFLKETVVIGLCAVDDPAAHGRHDECRRNKHVADELLDASLEVLKV
jgi:hypothetical protein